jgi:ribosome modulation factor
MTKTPFQAGYAAGSVSISKVAEIPSEKQAKAEWLSGFKAALADRNRRPRSS